MSNEILPPAPWLTRQTADGTRSIPAKKEKREETDKCAFNPFRWLRELTVNPDQFYKHVMAAAID